MSRLQALRVLLPYTLKRSISAYSNEMVLIFKGSSLVYTITLMDLMGVGKKLFGNTYDISIYVVVGVIYLVVNSLITLGMRILEKRALRFEQH